MYLTIDQVDFLAYVFTTYFHAVSSTGTVVYSEVKTFLKKQPNIITKYLSIVIRNESLTLTENHMVYARKNFVDYFMPMYVNLRYHMKF